jgi:serine/threonine protein phosphatase PrpC
MSELPAVASHGYSDVGKYREENQDSLRIQESDAAQAASHGYLYAIADGMGGYSHGGVASALALETFFDNFYTGQPQKSSNNLKQGIQSANTAVYQAAYRLGAVRMGTTLSAVNIIGNQLHIAHVGDSRVYLIRKGQSTCLTRDHTVVGDLVNMKVLSPDKIRKHEQRSVLNKCIGVQLFVQPDIQRFTLEQDDMLILCSDGVWSMIEDDEFAHLTHEIPNPDHLSQTLIELAMERDSDDNVSAIAVHIQDLPASAHEARKGVSFIQSLRSKLSRT